MSGTHQAEDTAVQRLDGGWDKKRTQGDKWWRWASEKRKPDCADPQGGLKSCAKEASPCEQELWWDLAPRF